MTRQRTARVARVTTAGVVPQGPRLVAEWIATGSDDVCNNPDNYPNGWETFDAQFFIYFSLHQTQWYETPRGATPRRGSLGVNEWDALAPCTAIVSSNRLDARADAAGYRRLRAGDVRNGARAHVGELGLVEFGVGEDCVGSASDPHWKFAPTECPWAAEARNCGPRADAGDAGVCELKPRVRARNRTIRRRVPGGYDRRREDLADQWTRLPRSRSAGTVRRHAGRRRERKHVLRMGCAVDRHDR